MGALPPLSPPRTRAPEPQLLLALPSLGPARYKTGMNRMDLFGDGLAELHYDTPDFAVLKPGRFVICAATGQRIALEELRYWNVELQEAYVDAAAATKRWLETRPKA